MRKLRNREMVNPAQRHIAEKWQSQNSSGLSGTRVWILNWLKVTESVDERFGFQLSVQSSDCNLVPSHSVQTLLLGHRFCISVYVFQLMELNSWFQKLVSMTQLWPALLVRMTDKGMGVCLQVAKKKKKKIHFENFSFWGREGFYFHSATICKETLVIIPEEGESTEMCLIRRNEVTELGGPWVHPCLLLGLSIIWVNKFSFFTIQ